MKNKKWGETLMKTINEKRIKMKNKKWDTYENNK